MKIHTTSNMAPLSIVPLSKLMDLLGAFHSDVFSEVFVGADQSGRGLVLYGPPTPAGHTYLQDVEVIGRVDLGTETLEVGRPWSSLFKESGAAETEAEREQRRRDGHF